MRSDAQVQLTQVPPKPTCTPNSIFDSGECRDSINAYNQAVQQTGARRTASLREPPEGIGVHTNPLHHFNSR